MRNIVLYSVCILDCQIKEQGQISAQGGNSSKINNSTGPNKRTGLILLNFIIAELLKFSQFRSKIKTQIQKLVNVTTYMGSFQKRISTHVP